MFFKENKRRKTFAYKLNSIDGGLVWDANMAVKHQYGPLDVT